MFRSSNVGKTGALVLHRGYIFATEMQRVEAFNITGSLKLECVQT